MGVSALGIRQQSRSPISMYAHHGMRVGLVNSLHTGVIANFPARLAWASAILLSKMVNNNRIDSVALGRAIATAVTRFLDNEQVKLNF